MRSTYLPRALMPLTQPRTEPPEGKSRRRLRDKRVWGDRHRGARDGPGEKPAPPWALCACSPRGQLVWRHAAQVVGIRQLQHVLLLLAEHGGPLHPHQHALAVAPQQEHLDLDSVTWGLQGQLRPLRPTPPTLLPALPPCWPRSGAAESAAGQPSPGPHQSHRRAGGYLPAPRGTGTGPVEWAESAGAGPV